MARAAWLAVVVCGCGNSAVADGDADADSDSDTSTEIDCGERPEAQAPTIQTFLRDSDYEKTWPHEPAGGRHPDLKNGPHGSPIEIFVRQCVADTWRTGAEQYPAGAMVVLDGYGKSAVPSVFVMYRTSDGSPWWWAGWDEIGIPIGEAGTDVGCDGCHSTGDDFVRSFSLEGI